MAYVVMASTAADRGSLMVYIAVAHMVMVCTAMACVLMACIVIADPAADSGSLTACIAYIDQCLYRYGLCGRGLYNYG